MILERYKLLTAIAIFLMLFGCIMPFLMALHVVESTFFLNFLSFGASVLGLFLGVAGIAGVRIVQKNKRDKDNPYE
jgi:hypothetical protein